MRKRNLVFSKFIELTASDLQPNFEQSVMLLGSYCQKEKPKWKLLILMITMASTKNSAFVGVSTLDRLEW